MNWYYILAKKPGEKRAMMVGTRGRRTNLRVRASQFSAGVVDMELARLRRDDPNWTFTAKPANGQYRLQVSTEKEYNNGH